MSREIAAAAVGCLVGAALALFANGATWVTATVTDRAASGLAAPWAVELTGAELAPAASALGLAGLAAVVGIAATGRVGRTLTGLLLVAVGVGIAFVAGRVLADPTAAAQAVAAVAEVAPSGAAELGSSRWTAAPWLTCLGGVLLILTGALVAVRCRGWPKLSRRYDQRPSRPRDAWDAIEQGQDPTRTG